MRIFLFRGLGGFIFSTGLNTLSKKLTAQGHQTSVHSWVERTSVQASAISDHQSGKLTDGIGLVGHSLGGNSASYMANNLVAANIPVSYVATIDPTEPMANPSGVVGDNFRSRDLRAEKVPGANDFSMPELNHVQIDKDARVHQHIVEACAARITSQGPLPTPVPEPESPNSPAPASSNQVEAIVNKLLNKDTGELNKNWLTILMASLGTNTPTLPESPAPDKPEDLPINNALGNFIGNKLNGRKTAFGILGLLGTAILPIMFPQLAPVKAVLENFGVVSDLVKTGEPGKGLLMPIFGALGSWGILGKIEKWVKIFRR